MDTWDVTAFGAVGDGVTCNGEAFSRAISACALVGGGRVIVPAGTWLTGPIQLRSNIDLHVQRGAIVLFSKNFDHYPLAVSDYEGEKTVRCASPVWGDELTNVSITGEGIFDGQGEAWRPVKKMKMTDAQWETLVACGGVVDDARGLWWPTADARAGEQIVHKLRQSAAPVRIEDYAKARDFLRPCLVKLVRCRGVLLDGPTFRNSAAWNVHLLLCEDIEVRNVTILNPWYSSNGDGLDLDACRNAIVHDSFLDVGDDAICIKSGKNEHGRRRGKACEDITIDNCTVLHGHGGVTIGSEMSGGVRNVRVTNCIFRGTDIGLRFKSTRGRGGTVENIDISNVTMSDIRHEAISLNMYYFARDPRPEPVSERTPCFRDIRIRNVTCDGARRAIEIRGLPEMPIERITLDNVRITAERGALLSDASDITFINVQVNAGDAPALHCHNVRNLRLENFNGDGPVEKAEGHLGDL